MSRSIESLILRLWKYTKINQTTGCWEWQGPKNPKGYGWIRFNKRSWHVHRVAAYLSLGLTEWDSRHALHRCDNPACWRWSHLYLGTNRDNISDSMRKGTHFIGRKGAMGRFVSSN